MEEIKNKISEIEQEIQMLYNNGYTDNSPEIKEKQSDLKRLYEKVKPEKDNKKPKIDKEQIKIKREISEIEQEIEMLYHEGYTDSSPEIKEKKYEIKELYAKIKVTKEDKENRSLKPDKEQIKIKNKISEIEQEIQMLYYEGYTDNSPEIKEKQDEVKELYSKIKVNKENSSSKQDKEQIEIKNKISEVEQEIQMLYYEGYTDNSPEIKEKKEEIKKLYSNMKETKKIETKQETIVNSKTELKPEPKPAPEQDSNTKPNQDIINVPEEDSILHPEAVDYYYNQANKSNQGDLTTTKESKLEKFANSVEVFFIGVAESKPVQFIKGIFSRLASSRLGRFFGNLWNGIKGSGKNVDDNVQDSKEETLNKNENDIEPEINDDYVIDDLEPDVKNDIEKVVEEIIESDGKEDFIDKKRKERNENAKNGTDRPLRDKDGNEIIIDEAGNQIIINKMENENPWKVNEEDLNKDPVVTNPRNDNSKEMDGPEL